MAENNAFESILADIRSHPRVQEMKRYIQHGRVSTYAHCDSVARLTYRIDQALHLHSDLDTLLKGAMLHDFYLYDWHHEDGGGHRLHGFSHADTACRNAVRILQINAQIQRVIRCHMWPLNPERIPTSREAWIVCIADKWVALRETLCRRK